MFVWFIALEHHSAFTKSSELHESLTSLKKLLNLGANPFTISIDNKYIYHYWLEFLHHVVKASVPLLEAAQQRSSALEGTLYTQLADYFSMHALEENGHDDWLLADVMSFSKITPLYLPASYEIAALVGAQYYWIQHHDPVVFLGYVAALEAFPPQYSDIKKLSEITQLPLSSFQTLMHHAAIDNSHMTYLYSVIDGLEITRSQMQQIIQNALRTLIELDRAKKNFLNGAINSTIPHQA